MVYKFMLFFATVILSWNVVHSDISEDKSFTCEFIDNIPSEINACLSEDSCDIAYYASVDDDGSGELINGKISTLSSTPGGVMYPYAFKCESELEVELDFEYREGTNRCSENQFEFGFLKEEYNSKLSYFYSISDYNISICLNTLNTDFGSLDIKIEDERSSDLAAIGFDCMYRFSSDPTEDGVNSKLSSCDAEFTSPSGVISQYPYLIYARLTPNIESSTCNQDCTSTIDGRIYSACGDTILECENVPTQCDGSLLGEWIKFDDDTDIFCGGDFNQFRSTSQSQVSISVDSEGSGCENIITQQYSVQIDSEAVQMNIYICGD